MTFEFEAGPDLYYEAPRTISKTTRQGRIRLMVTWIYPVGFGALALLLLLLGEFLMATAGLAVTALGTGYALLIPLIQKRHLARNLRANPSSAARLRYEVDSSGIAVNATGTTTHIPWANVISVEESKALVIFMTARNFGYFLPKNVLNPGDLEQIAG